MSTSHRHRRAASLFDYLWILIILALLISILLPSLSRARELAKRTVCASNLRGVGTSIVIYANDYRGDVPRHYAKVAPPTAGSPEHGVRWVGSMGSNDFLRISQPTTAEISPTRSHPSRSLFLTITFGMTTPGMFICPSSGDEQDSLRNYGADASDGQISAAAPGISRFDFSGYRSLSYGYQLPYGPGGREAWFGNEGATADVRAPLMADKSPYYTRGGDGLAGTRTTRDARSKVNPSETWAKDSLETLIRRDVEAWRPFNSVSHAGEGQNVMYVDTHVEFARKPTAGLNFDNIYTLAANDSPGGRLIGRVPSADQAHGPMTERDTFIVP